MTIKLSGFNYDIWFQSFLIYVTSHDKNHILEEDELADKMGNNDLWKENFMMMAWIINSVDEGIAAITAYYAVKLM